MPPALVLDGPGCAIQHCEERGISILQLCGVLEHIRADAHTWIDARTTKVVKAEKANLYQVVEHFLKPATEQRKCSFVELIAKDVQRPRWFVSHWWGEPVLLFVLCVLGHARLRHLLESSCYWVCAYANNQWELDNEVTEDPAESSFRKAMAIAEGTLSIIDENGTTFTRIWCCFEIAVTLSKESSKLYDMATIPKGGEPVVLTDGLTFEDLHKGAEYGPDYEGGPRGHKMRREMGFPLELAKMAFSVRVEEGEASRSTDRIHILNSIAGVKDLNRSPQDACDAYDHINRALHGRFAVGLYRLALERAWPILPDVLQPSMVLFPCKDLALSFFECEVLNNKHLGDLFGSLPVAVKALHLDLTGCRSLVSQAGAAQEIPTKKIARPAAPIHELFALPGLCRLTQLTSLTLDFSRCLQLTELDIIGSFECLTALQQLSLSFNMCQNLTDVSRLQSLEVLAALVDLSLYFNSCSALEDSSVLSLLQGCQYLTKLLVEFGGSSIKGCPVQGSPPRLVTLSLNFVRCLQLQDLLVLEGLSSIKTLQKVALNFNLCGNIHDVRGMRDILKFPPSTEFEMSFRGCPFATSRTQRIGSISELASFYTIGLFSKLDVNGDGFIDRRELANIFQICSAALPPIDELLIALDKDEDGRVNYVEFISWIMLGRSPSSLSMGVADCSLKKCFSESIFVGNTAKKEANNGRQRWAWTFYVRGCTDVVQMVVLHLHPTFRPPVRELRGPIFEETLVGWGTFAIDVRVHWKRGGELRTTWELQFNADSSKAYEVPTEKTIALGSQMDSSLLEYRDELARLARDESCVVLVDSFQEDRVAKKKSGKVAAVRPALEQVISVPSAAEEEECADEGVDWFSRFDAVEEKTERYKMPRMAKSAKVDCRSYDDRRGGSHQHYREDCEEDEGSFQFQDSPECEELPSHLCECVDEHFMQDLLEEDAGAYEDANANEDAGQSCGSEAEAEAEAEEEVEAKDEAEAEEEAEPGAEEEAEVDLESEAKAAEADWEELGQQNSLFE